MRFSALVAAYIVGACFVVGACVVEGAFAVFAEFLCALGAAVVVPLAVAAATPDPRTPLEKLCVVVVPVGGVCALVSLTQPASTTALALALPWWAATSTVAAAALQRILRRGVRPLGEFAVDVGHLYVVVGAVWLVANRGAHSVMGFQEPVVLYTATHFHFAGCAAPVVAGLVLRELERGGLGRTARAVVVSGVVVVIGGIPLVAAGIVFTHAVEFPAAVLLALAMWIVMGGLVVAGVRRLRGDGTAAARASGALLVVAGLCLALSMSLVVVFAATGSVTRGAAPPLVPYEWMVRLHGGANALGFSLCALVAFVWQPPPRRRDLGGSFPDVFFGGFVGVDVFDRNGRAAEDSDRVVVGQLERLEEFDSDTFRAAAVDRRVRDFYERTGDHALLVTPQWHLPFSLVAPVVVAVARNVVGNCVLPLRPEREETVRARLFPLRDDGRTQVRGYVRSVDGAANFVAAYATHTRRADDGAGRSWLSVGLPLPWSWLVAVLRFENVGALGAGGGLAVTSHPQSDADVDDEGLFFVCRFGVVRLPLNERIEVFVDDAGDAAAVHVTRCCGLCVCTLRYRLLKTTTTTTRQNATIPARA